eukprot:COSAG02_NODE_6358_length_3627_cov_4.287698_1_plen_36_part_00
MSVLYMPLKGYGQIYISDDLRQKLSDPEYSVTPAL